MTNTFGELFRITTWGESHGAGIGVVIDGVPPGVVIDSERIAAELRRRRPGGRLASPRQEPDVPEILSGVKDGRALGTPLAILIRNVDARPEDYRELEQLYRPGHADYTTAVRYGIRDARGGGRASARETAARVAAGEVALQVLNTYHPEINIVAWVDEIKDMRAKVVPDTVSRSDVDASVVRCPDPAATKVMERWIADAARDGDSLGGTVRVVARGVPAGWGDPVFGKLKARLATALMSLPAAVGFDVGLGFASTALRGSEHNDRFQAGAGSEITLASNRAGGIQGGITNGAPILARVAFHPPSTIRVEQQTVSVEGKEVSFSGTGRHDPCVLPRAVPIVEAMVALVLVDCMLSRWAHPPVSGGGTREA